MALKPTIWKTCRALANLRRLELLAELLDTPGQTVTAVAATVGLSVNLASRYLRDLNARGLLRAKRLSRFVRYYPEADRLVASTVPLLVALSKTLSRNDIDIKRAFRILTAMTHPRRVEIVRLLKNGPQRPRELRRLAQISRPALMRHLRKLVDHGFVFRKKVGVLELVRQKDVLVCCLVKLAGSQKS